MITREFFFSRVIHSINVYNLYGFRCAWNLKFMYDWKYEFRYFLDIVSKNKRCKKESRINKFYKIENQEFQKNCENYENRKRENTSSPFARDSFKLTSTSPPPPPKYIQIESKLKYWPNGFSGQTKGLTNKMLRIKIV